MLVLLLFLVLKAQGLEVLLGIFQYHIIFMMYSLSLTLKNPADLLEIDTMSVGKGRRY